MPTSPSAMDTDEPMAQDEEGQDDDQEDTEVVVRSVAEPEAAAAQTDRDALMAGVAAGNIYLPAGHGSETMELPQASSRQSSSAFAAWSMSMRCALQRAARTRVADVAKGDGSNVFVACHA